MKRYDVRGNGDGGPRRTDTLAAHKRNRRRRNGGAWKKALVWAVTAWTLGMAPAAQANPVLDAAGAGVTVNGLNTANVAISSTASDNLIKWVDFSVGKNETVAFDGNMVGLR